MFRSVVMTVVFMCVVECSQLKHNLSTRRLNNEPYHIGLDVNRTRITFADPKVANKVKELLQLCYTSLERLFMYCDLLEANCDWIFTVMIEDNDYYSHRAEADKVYSALLEGRIPQDITPLPSFVRQAIIHNICYVMSGKHVTTALSYDFYALRPYTIKGALRVAALNTLLRPYNLVPADVLPLVSQCADFLRGLIRYYKTNLIAYDELIKNVLGLDPMFPPEKWCALLLNLMERRVVEARSMMTETTTPSFDLSVYAWEHPREFNKMMAEVSTEELQALLVHAHLGLEP